MLFERFEQVRAFIFAVEGVCTDGNVWISDRDGRWFRLHNRDCYALRLAAPYYPIALVGDTHSDGMVQLMAEIGITDSFVNREDQRAVGDWMSARGLAAGQVLCMGSDIADLDNMAAAGFGTCPGDAVEDVKAASVYISHCHGGSGAVRDVIEKVMRLQGRWNGNIKMQSL